jgi:hypothetical protein
MPLEEKSMRKILAILIAVVLLSLNFTFSSCKSCNKNKSKDSSKDNPITDRDKDKSDNVSILDNPDLAKIKEHLQARGASPTEIEATMHIATEDLGEGIGRIVHIGGHFVYKDSRGVDRDGRQTTNSCALYAMKRLLFVLGKHHGTGIDENLWYEYTDQELRDKLAAIAISGCENLNSPGVTISNLDIWGLMVNVGIPIKYCRVYRRNYGEETISCGAPPLTADELARLTAKIHKEIPLLQERMGRVVNSSNEAIGKVRAWMAIVKSASESDLARNTAAAKVITAAGELKQAVADAKAVSKLTNLFACDLYNNMTFGFWEIPEHLIQFATAAGHASVLNASHVETSATEAAALAAEAKKICPKALKGMRLY